MSAQTGQPVLAVAFAHRRVQHIRIDVVMRGEELVERGIVAERGLAEVELQPLVTLIVRSMDRPERARGSSRRR